MQATTLDWSPARRSGREKFCSDRAMRHRARAHGAFDVTGRRVSRTCVTPPPRARAARRSAREQIGATAPDFSHPGLARANRLASAAMTRDELKGRVFAAIDRTRSEIIALGERIRQQPELGFKEFKTARLVEETFGELGPEATWRARHDRGARGGGGRPGTGRPSPCSASWTACVVAGHPMADPRPGPPTRAATTRRWRGCSAPRWACSRRAPSSTSPAAWSSSRCPPRSTATWSGACSRRGRPHRVPRRQAGAAAPRPLRRRGPRDDDPHHLAPGGRKAGVAASNNGCVGKTVRYIGRASHAGGAPAHGDQRALRGPDRPGRRSTRSARRSATRTRSGCTRSSPTGAAR